VGLISLFLYAYLRWSELSITNLLRHNWAWGVIGAVLLGMFTVHNILPSPPLHEPKVYLWCSIYSGLELSMD
jgi:hypothetical protein